MEAYEQKRFWEREIDRRPPQHPVVEAFALPKIQLLNRYIDIKKNTRILDVGCGNGFFTYYFEKISDYIVGLDYSNFMLSINAHKPLVRASVLYMPFKENSFDIVFSSNFLHHLEEPIRALSEMKRVSKEFVAISEPNRNNPLMFLFSILVKEESGGLKFSLFYLKRLIELAGLGTIYSTRLGSIVPNKTPKFLLGILKRLDREFPLGLYSMVIARK